MWSFGSVAGLCISSTWYVLCVIRQLAYVIQDSGAAVVATKECHADRMAPIAHAADAQLQVNCRHRAIMTSHTTYVHAIIGPCVTVSNARPLSHLACYFSMV